MTTVAVGWTQAQSNRIKGQRLKRRLKKSEGEFDGDLGKRRFECKKANNKKFERGGGNDACLFALSSSPLTLRVIAPLLFFFIPRSQLLTHTLLSFLHPSPFFSSFCTAPLPFFARRLALVSFLPSLLHSTHLDSLSLNN